MVEVTQADRELFITLSNADGQMAERILCGQAFTWEVEQIARHRLAEREAVVKWLRRMQGNAGKWSPMEQTVAAACRYLADAIEAGEPFK